MSEKELKINFRYLIGNIACMSVDSIEGKPVHNDINDEAAIIIFNSLVGEKENCKTVKTLLEENQLLKIQVSSREEVANKYKEVIKEVREWLKYKAETLDEFDIPKRKETGAFWFSTRGEIDNLLQILDKGESNE